MIAKFISQMLQTAFVLVMLFCIGWTAFTFTLILRAPRVTMLPIEAQQQPGVRY